MERETWTTQIDFEHIGITNDFMFCTVLEDEGRCKEFLERVLGIEIAEISLVQKQWTEQNHFEYKGIRLDVYVKDVEGNSYDCELQTTTEAYLAKRCRYYHSEMDGYQIRRGIKYKHLKRSIVIFICTYDPFGENFSVYTFEKTCREKPELILEDEVQTIILNTTGIRDGLSEGLTNLLDYIKTGKVTDTYTAELQKQVEVLKYDEDWRDRYMTLEMKMEEKYDAGYGVGIKTGRKNGDLSRIFSLITRKLQKNKNLEQIADELEEEVDEIAPLVEHARKYAPAYDIEQMVSGYLKDNEI